MTIKTKNVAYETMIHMTIERSRACDSDTGNDDLKQWKVKTSRVMPLPTNIEASYSCDSAATVDNKEVKCGYDVQTTMN